MDKRLARWRPQAWEDDISRNTLDTAAFENVMPPCQLPEKQFQAPNHLKALETLLGGKTLKEMIANDTYPIPGENDREGYSMGYDGVYWLSGLTDYLKIMEVAKRYNVQPKSYFDFGCATGRVLRHFAVQENLDEVWGSDINGRHVRWLYENMPANVKPIFNHCIPAIPIPDKSVDIISAFSVFTHIDTFETCWLAELSRIMKDDGLCYLTVHNEDTWAALQKDVGNENNRLIKSIFKIDPEMETKIHEPMPDMKTVFRFTDFGPYRAQVFHSNNYLEKVWGRYFKIEEILGCHHVRQTVLVLRKK